MTEFIVRTDYERGIEVGVADPGFDGSKWTHSNKIWFSITPDEARELMEKLMIVCGEQSK